LLLCGNLRIECAALWLQKFSSKIVNSCVPFALLER
jgi:hypothetical protein